MGGEAAEVESTRDGGTRWTYRASLRPSPSTIGSALFATTVTWRSAQDGFILNAYSPETSSKSPRRPILQAFVTQTGGKTWRRVSIRTHGLLGGGAALAFSSLATGWLALGKRNGSIVIESTTDQGRHWRAVWRLSPALAETEAPVRSVDQVDARVGCVVFQTTLRCTDNGGRSWYSPHL